MRGKRLRPKLVAGLGAWVVCGMVASVVAGQGQAVAGPQQPFIQHVVVIFGENISFDHYFGTYRPAPNGPYGAQTVNALYNTPGANGTGTLLNNNPNPVFGSSPAIPNNPRQLDPTNVNDILTCDQDHGYTDEQTAFDGGKMDNFPSVSKANVSGNNPNGQPCSPSDVMNYYAGDTVTAMWNYANHFGLNDNSFGTTFGPSAPGAINLVSGNTNGVDLSHSSGKAAAIPFGTSGTAGYVVGDGNGGSSLIGDGQPLWDDCSTNSKGTVGMLGENIGNLLNTAGLSWGWFEGGFRPTTTYAAATTNATPPTSSTYAAEPFATQPATITLPAGASYQGLCNAVHPVGPAVGGVGSSDAKQANSCSPASCSNYTPGMYGWKDDYIPHHEPFQFYASTANPHHLPPASLAAIGKDTQTSSGSGSGAVYSFDTANHNYDASDFDALVGAISRGALPASALPAVSFLKAAGYQDAHAAYSDPLDEQQFVVKEINALEHTPDWSSTAVVLAWDDSDGFYDHVYSATAPTATGLANQSQSAADTLTGSGQCGTGTPKFGGQGALRLRTPTSVPGHLAVRQGGFADHTLTDQSSIIHFIQQNWHLPFISGSADQYSGSLMNMFDFARHEPNPPLFLDPVTGRESITAAETIQEHKK